MNQKQNMISYLDKYWLDKSTKKYSQQNDIDHQVAKENKIGIKLYTKPTFRHKKVN